MIYEIHMGVPEMDAFWNTLQVKVKSGKEKKLKKNSTGK